MGVRVPVLDAPSAQERPLPVVPAAVPPETAFGGQTGAALEGPVTEGIHKIAQAARERAVREMADEAETGALRQQMAVRKEYVQKFGVDARDSWPEYEKRLYEIRDNIGRELEKKSRDARLTFDFGSLRNERIELGVMETHFSTQARVARIQNYKGRLITATDGLSHLSALNGSALDQKTAIDTAQEYVDTNLRPIIDREAEDRGIDPADREAFLKQELRAPLTGFINGLIDNKNPAAKEAMSRWGGLLKEGEQRRNYKAMSDQDVVDRATRIVAGLPRFDTDRHEDEHGFVPYESVLSQTRAVSTDESIDQTTRAKVVKEIWNEYDKDNARFQKAGDQLEAVVDRQGQGRGPGGAWAIPEGSRDWLDYQRLYSARAKNMGGKQRVVEAGDLKRSVAEARGGALEDYERMDPEEQKVQKYEQIASMVRAHEPKATGEDIEQVWKRVQTLQSAKGDEVSKKMSTTVQKGLKAAFGKNQDAITKYGGMARDFGDYLHESDPKLKEEEIVSRITNEASNWVPGFFTKAKPFVRPPRPARPAEPQSVTPLAKPDSAASDDEWIFNADGSVTPPKGKK